MTLPPARPFRQPCVEQVTMAMAALRVVWDEAVEKEAGR